MRTNVETSNEQREERAKAAASHFIRMAKNASANGDHDTAAMANQKAEVAAEAARAKYDYIQDTMPVVLDNLARFYETGKPQMIVLTEPHPFNDELFEKIYAAAGVKHKEDFENDQQQQAKVPIPSDVQEAYNLDEPFINAVAWDSPMGDGKVLYRLDYTSNTTGENGETESVNKIMILASDHILPPE